MLLVKLSLLLGLSLVIGEEGEDMKFAYQTDDWICSGPDIPRHKVGWVCTGCMHVDKPQDPPQNMWCGHQHILDEINDVSLAIKHPMIAQIKNARQANPANRYVYIDPALCRPEQQSITTTNTTMTIGGHTTTTITTTTKKTTKSTTTMSTTTIAVEITHLSPDLSDREDDDTDEEETTDTSTDITDTPDSETTIFPEGGDSDVDAETLSDLDICTESLTKLTELRDKGINIVSDKQIEIDNYQNKIHELEGIINCQQQLLTLDHKSTCSLVDDTSDENYHPLVTPPTPSLDKPCLNLCEEML